MSTTTIENKQAIIDKADDILKRSVSRDEKLFAICELLDDEVEVFDWIGFYKVNPQNGKELVLGPYVGESTEHTHIPFGKGICGQAAETKKTYVSQDVSKEENYLACSINVEAEIVVPILKDGEIAGELDIDSHTKNSITDEHQDMLEAICKKIASEF